MECEEEMEGIQKTFTSEDVGEQDGWKILRVDLKSAHDALIWLDNYERSNSVKFIVEDSMSSDPKRLLSCASHKCVFSGKKTALQTGFL